MAAIDKIYGNKDQYDEFRSWCQENHPRALQYFYDWIWTDEENHPITNFPHRIDYWMLDNCPIGWVVEYIRDQYNMKPKA